MKWSKIDFHEIFPCVWWLLKTSIWGSSSGGDVGVVKSVAENRSGWSAMFGRSVNVEDEVLSSGDRWVRRPLLEWFRESEIAARLNRCFYCCLCHEGCNHDSEIAGVVAMWFSGEWRFGYCQSVRQLLLEDLGILCRVGFSSDWVIWGFFCASGSCDRFGKWRRRCHEHLVSMAVKIWRS